eukprot:GHVP01014103.1.p1 GENE.GHVP01014103.1~~GHVP01014103.1.p1  ORF type:complete len:918 (-),score=176.96 GHVP01014103.1:52-2805(-)
MGKALKTIIEISTTEKEDEEYHKTFVATLKARAAEKSELKGQTSIRSSSAVTPKSIENEISKEENLGSERLFSDEEPDQMYMGGADPGNEMSYFELLNKGRPKRELPVVDHSSINYRPFTKNLYIQVREVSAMTDRDVEVFRKTSGNIRVHGKHCPRPIRSFFQCGLRDVILNELVSREYEKPFPIQAQAIPALMCGRDVIGIAETGSGKTIAYLLPIIRQVLNQEPVMSGEGPIGLIMAPTRELVYQISQEATKLTKLVDRHTVAVYGGAAISSQLAGIKKGADILCATPGRLIHVMTLNSGKLLSLERVCFLVLDEADRMFDLGFEPQIAAITQNIRPDCQKALFSATFPKHIENFVKKLLHKPLEIIVGEKGRTASRVFQEVEVLTFLQKPQRLLQLLGEWYEHGSIIVFVSRKEDADYMFAELRKYSYDALVLHGGQDHQDRRNTIKDFKKGEKRILIATSVAARGLDVPSVVLVINYDTPDHAEDYVHRIGRTGRAGNIGCAITFITESEGAKAEDMIKVLNETGQSIPPVLSRLAEEYKLQCNLGIQSETKRTGFGGRGFTFSENEKSRLQQERGSAMKELGIGEDLLALAGEVVADAGEFEHPMAPAAEELILPQAILQIFPLLSLRGTPAAAANADAIEEQLRAAYTYMDALQKLGVPLSNLSNLIPQAQPKQGQTGAATAAGAAAAQAQYQLDPVMSNRISTVILEKVLNQHFDDSKSTQYQTHLNALMPTIKQCLLLYPSLSSHLMSDPPQIDFASTLVSPVSQLLKQLDERRAARGLEKKTSKKTKAPASQLKNKQRIEPSGSIIEELDINDYPDIARSKLTKTVITQLVSECGCEYVEVKGHYIPPNARPTDVQYAGLERLHVVFAAKSQFPIQSAKREVRNYLESISISTLTGGGRMSGRYEVL